MSELQHGRIAALCAELRLSAVPDLYGATAQAAAAGTTTCGLTHTASPHRPPSSTDHPAAPPGRPTRRTRSDPAAAAGRSIQPSRWQWQNSDVNG